MLAAVSLVANQQQESVDSRKNRSKRALKSRPDKQQPYSLLYLLPEGVVGFCREEGRVGSIQSVVSVTLYINGEARSGGHISLDLSSILNPLSYKTPSHKEFDKVLEKSVLKNSRLKFGVKAVYVKEMLQEELGQIQRQ